MIIRAWGVVTSNIVADAGSSMGTKCVAAKPRRFSAKHLRGSCGVYNCRPTSHAIMACMLALTQCTGVYASVPVQYKTSTQIRSELRKKLAQSLSRGAHEKAFAKQCAFDHCPRADDPAAMM